MNRVFNPFLGNQYGQDRSLFQERVLCLGDSHYGTTNVVSNTTKEVVRRYLKAEEKESWFSTFTKGLEALIGQNLKENTELTARLFHSICFYNYVQTPMTEAREKPALEEYQNSADPFFQTLEELQPDIVVVWGARLWNNLPWDKLEYRNCEKINNYKLYSCTYTLSTGKKVLLLRIYHPSSGFSWKKWYECLRQYIHKKYSPLSDNDSVVVHTIINRR